MPDRHPSRDREYIEGQIARGFECVVDGHTYNRSNVSQLPSQEELDGDAPTKPATRAKPEPSAPKAKGEPAAPKAKGE